jgi:hypothetical protein
MKAPWRTKRLTEEERQEIRRLRLEGLRNVDICRKLGLNRNTVHKSFVKMNLPVTRRPPVPEKKVLALLEKRVEWRTIGRTLHVSHRSVAEFARAHGYARPRKELTPGQRMRLIEDVLSRSASAAALAKKHHASYKTVLALAHDLLKCERFLPSWRTPLTSYFPSRPPKPMKAQQDGPESLTLQLVDKVCRRFLNGALPAPAKENNFIQALSVIVIPEDGSPDLNQCPREAVRQNFEARLHEAIDTLRQAQTGLVN